MNPFFWVLLLLIWSIFVADKRKRNKLVIISIAIFFLFGNSIIINEIGIRVEKKWRAEAKNLTQLPDTAILLGGYGSFDDDLERTTLTEAGDRLFQVLKKYQSGEIGTLVISGGSGSLMYPDFKEADITKQYLIEGRFRNDNIIVESNSRNTYENAIFTKGIIGTQNPRVLLVTSAFHMKRAKKVFSKAGFEPVAYPSNFLFNPKRQYDLSSFLIPKAKSYMNWELLLKEQLGIMVYKIKGYL